MYLFYDKIIKRKWNDVIEGTIKIMELLGTAAFATSGSLVAISMVLIFVIRMLATRYRWSLPRIHIENELK